MRSGSESPATPPTRSTGGPRRLSTRPRPSRRREEARSYAVEVLVRLARDNPELVPEYTDEMARREAARKETR